MRELYDIQDIMYEELKEICKKDEITSTDLETTYKIVDILKDIVTIDAMHKADREKQSNNWDDDYSYSRGRDNRGHYGRSSKDDMIDHLTDLMRNARTDEERENYRKTIDQLSR